MIGILIIGLVVVFIFIFNSLILARNAVDNAMALVDANLKKRCDLIGELAAAISGHLVPEGKTLAELAVFRRNDAVAEKARKADELSCAAANVMAQAVQVPELKEAERISEIQSALNELAGQFDAVKQNYNKVAAGFNNAIQTQPDKIFAKMMKLAPRELLP